MYNQIKTVLFLALLTGILLGIGYMFGPYGLVIGLGFALLMNFISYFYSDKIVLWMYKAKVAERLKYPELHAMIESVAKLADVPKPKVYIIKNANPNAFATGRNPKNAAVAVTTGIMELLNKEELKGVIAHEISHVKNRDILIATIAATIAGVISFVGAMARLSAIFGGRDNNDGAGRLLGLLVLGIITPIMAFLIQMAISRSREYLADESAAKLLKDSKGLAVGLKRLESGVREHPFIDESAAGASLFIVNPFSAKGLVNLLSTHPPISERIKRLDAMKF